MSANLNEIARLCIYAVIILAAIKVIRGEPPIIDEQHFQYSSNYFYCSKPNISENCSLSCVCYYRSANLTESIPSFLFYDKSKLASLESSFFVPEYSHIYKAYITIWVIVALYVIFYLAKLFKDWF